MASDSENAIVCNAGVRIFSMVLGEATAEAQAPGAGIVLNRGRSGSRCEVFVLPGP